MEELRQRLAFLTDWIAEDIREWAAPEVWWLAMLTAALFALYIFFSLAGAFFTALFGSGKAPVTSEWEPDLQEDLQSLPLANSPPAAQVYHLPARLRLVVLAPAGKNMKLDGHTVDALLDKVVPGLGKLAMRDRPRIVLWPPPASPSGFNGSFHRATPTGESPESPTRWIMLCGRARGGGETVFLGLVLWADEPSTVGRRNLEFTEWLEILRLGSAS